MKIKATKTEPTSGSYMAIWKHNGHTFATSIKIDEGGAKWETTPEHRHWRRQDTPIRGQFSANPEIIKTLMYIRLE